MMKLVANVGIYEKGQYPGWADKRPTKEYQMWNDMHNRCQPNDSQQLKHPTYIGCSVHPGFIKFQDFAEWCNNQIGFGLKGWALDKDILIQCNKVYGPDTCAFVPRQLNQLLTHKQSHQGEYPTGVTYFKRDGTYHAQISIDGKNQHLGYFDSIESAEVAYKIAKTNEILRRAEIWKSQIDPRVYEALLKYKV